MGLIPQEPVAEANLICMPAFRSLKAPAPSVRIKNAVAPLMILPANAIAKIMRFPSRFAPRRPAI